MRKFHFMDFAAHFQKGFRNHIVAVTEVPRLTESFGHYGCYATYFFYADEILTYLTARAAETKPSIGGYQGKVWAPYFPIDIDHADLETALAAARFFLKLFQESWKLDPAAYQVYFSGLKGFHLMIDSRAFGKVVASKNLPLLFAALRRHLMQELPEPLRGTVDLSIKDGVRLLRLPNTIHEKSGLYKIILTPEELQSLTLEDIRQLARSPRPLLMTDETGFIPKENVEANPTASKLFRRVQRQVRHFTRKPFQYHFRRPEDLSHIQFPCQGVQKIWENHVEAGYRNNCAIRLASELRLLGLTLEEAREKLLEWNDKNVIGLPAYELESVVHSAYHPPFPYRYSCRDEILRHFCPLSSLESCQTYLTRHSQAA